MKYCVYIENWKMKTKVWGWNCHRCWQSGTESEWEKESHHKINVFIKRILQPLICTQWIFYAYNVQSDLSLSSSKQLDRSLWHRKKGFSVICKGNVTPSLLSMALPLSLPLIFQGEFLKNIKIFVCTLLSDEVMIINVAVQTNRMKILFECI